MLVRNLNNFLFGFVLVSCEFFAFPVNAKDPAPLLSLPCGDAEDDEIAQLKAEIAKLKADKEELNKKAAPKIFTVSLNCAQFNPKEEMSAYNMCIEAGKELNKNTVTGHHEASHYINSMCRNMSQYRGKKGTCIHVNWDGIRPVITWISEPRNTTIKGLRTYIPDFMKKNPSKYQTYLINSQLPPPNLPRGAKFEPWTNLTYLFDEWGAYNMGSRKYLDDRIKGPYNDLTEDFLHGPISFTIFGASIAQYTQKADPEYFISEEFKSFLKFQIETSMSIVQDGIVAQKKKKVFGKGDIEIYREMIDQFTRSSQAQLLRTMYGDVWFDETFNITF